jgi:4-hydroxybenzoate polyprenyltransferase
VLGKVRRLLEMIRFSHTVFALPFAMLAAVMAWNEGMRSTPPVDWRWRDLAGILVSMALARSAAMTFNRIADRNLDALNPRTSSRHLPTGVLSLATAVAFLAVCSVGFVAGTLLFLPNRWPLYGSVPVLLFLFGYSFAKRFTAMSHFWLGAALMLAPVAAWVALRGELAWAPVVLGSAVLLWVAGFDIIYACQDFEFDRRTGLKSVPARLGVAGALRLAMACHAGTVLLLFALPLVYRHLGRIYLGGIVAVAVLLIYEHWLVRPEDLTRVNRAFFHVNALVSIGLFVVGTVDLLM